MLKVALSNLWLEFTFFFTGIRRLDIWWDDSDFNSLLNRVASKEHLVMNNGKLYQIYQFAKRCQKLRGHVAELGVYRGGTAKFLAETFELCSERQLHLFDTFSGFPLEGGEWDHYQKGELGDTSFEQVKSYLCSYQNIRYYAGAFKQTLVQDSNIPDQFCFVHVDCDLYQSTLESISFFFPRLVKGGVMLFDDYGFLSCPGAKQAVLEYFRDKDQSLLVLPTGQSLVIKQ